MHLPLLRILNCVDAERSLSADRDVRNPGGLVGYFVYQPFGTADRSDAVVSFSFVMFVSFPIIILSDPYLVSCLCLFIFVLVIRYFVSSRFVCRSRGVTLSLPRRWPAAAAPPARCFVRLLLVSCCFVFRPYIQCS